MASRIRSLTLLFPLPYLNPDSRISKPKTGATLQVVHRGLRICGKLALRNTTSAGSSRAVSDLIYKSLKMSHPRRTTDITSKKDKSTLEEAGIVKEYFDPKRAPAHLRSLLVLIIDVEHIQWETHPRYKVSKRRNSEQRNWAAHDYDKKLVERAFSLWKTCIDPKRENNKENEWMEVLSPKVFHRFNREEEESADYHHWYEVFQLTNRVLTCSSFVCRLHYPKGSRPTINIYSQQSPRISQGDMKFNLW